ncbi:MarR family winged helix-turn-helix transcriptional regulator [Thermosipho atlanticus]|uniref:DNA-binding transcriptional regulator, MarR family n=1 Tax=Thermosipho atlanticus DSM 15807 TaxID=1123380 RepID=A0A1M5S0H2_9BACT|nr:MarR family transcriptional regulator [Thermosipho atlanticus]SHH31949.1 DNA-binding transcriptional regulator, MarR family [Thermosipho atlanticus DSM 15807]
MNFNDFSEVFKLLSEFGKVRFQILRSALENDNVHPGQVPMLFIISSNPGISQNEIAKRMHITSSTVAIMLRRMEKHGLVERKQNEQDRRELKVYLTEKAKKLVEKLFEKMKNFESLSLRNFSKDEIETFENLLRKMLKNLEAMKHDETF